MMYGYTSVMGGFGSLFSLLWLVVFADLILLGIWLWKQITKS